MFRRCGKGTKYIDINNFFLQKKRSEVKKNSLLNELILPIYLVPSKL